MALPVYHNIIIITFQFFLFKPRPEAKVGRKEREEGEIQHVVSQIYIYLLSF